MKYKKKVLKTVKKRKKASEQTFITDWMSAS